MKTVFQFLLLGVALGGVPGLLYLSGGTEWYTPYRHVFFTIVVCFGAIFGSLIGATEAIITGYQRRHQEDYEEPVLNGFWYDIYSYWNPPVGHAQRDWRHRMEYRRHQIIQACIMGVVLVFVFLIIYTISED